MADTPYDLPAGLSPRSGLPCRGGCDRIFPVRPDILVAGSSAAQERDGHELAAHGYVHVCRDIAGPTPFSKPMRLVSGREYIRKVVA